MRRIYLSGSRDIKDLLARVLTARSWSGKRVLDFPAGSGYTSELLHNQDAHVEAWDMFPEFFKVPALKCSAADLQAKFPAQDESFEYAIFQEGIEHVPDQLFALREFNRVLKADGKLIVTTPNYSNLRSRYAYFCFESETPKMMPPNEIESIWYGADQRVYYGHIFSIGISRLRLLAKLAGFRLIAVHPARLNISSLVIGLFAMPFILLKTFSTYRRALRKNRPLDPRKKQILRNLAHLNLHPSILFGGHLIVEFTKEPTAERIEPVFEKIEET